ncbi:MAG: ethyl tert-butyl ether degradation protein EthD [Burkholderiaceae bacterium]|nr:MAG: ethyl tert-butyl ether degradation protein EthD [Burkholderiaceae bacterium]TAM04318.1 MAG: ethyl tert-butyl ether degradation protein EthD [Pusillimonas sp.]
MPDTEKGGDVVSLFITYGLMGPRDALLVLPPEWRQSLPAIAGLNKVLLHQTSKVDDPFLGKEPARANEYVLQFYFDDLFSLEAASAHQGKLGKLTDQFEALLEPVAFKDQQVMTVRHYPIAGQPDHAATTPLCTYLVAYYSPGKSHDVWLSEYISKHVPLMRELPAIREVEIYTKVDWLSELALPRADAIQRNKVVFDDAQALQVALDSPVRAQMRADYLALPQMGLTNTHVPMRTDLVFSRQAQS